MIREAANTILVAVTAGTEAVVPDFCRDSSVGIAKHYGLDVWGSIPGRGLINDLK
jgi:hypothetical protein